MKKGDNIFVYGTLKPGHSANGLMKDRATHIGQDRISGVIYSLGGFPGLKLVDDKTEFDPQVPLVSGDLYEITDDELPNRLDGYEGYPNLYDRRRVTTEGGRETWVYVLQGIPSEDRRIDSGVW